MTRKIEIQNTRSELNSSLINKGPSIFVWGIWLLMLVIALRYFLKYTQNIPLAEDWNMVAAVTGKQANIVRWLWEQNNEHRIPLPKIILLFLLKTTKDFRAGMVLNILSSALLAAFFIKAMHKLRGNKTYYSDAFFPIALLHIGNWENLFWSWQFTFILSTFLTCIVIIVLVQYRQLLTMPKAILVCICMIGLPLSGANGLISLLPVFPWLVYETYLQFRSREPGASRAVGILLLSSILITIFFVIVYFIGYYRPSWNPPSPSVWATLKTSAKFMANGFGPAVSFSWPVFSLIALSLISSTIILLINALLKLRGPEFRRALAMFFFLGGSIVFALAIGWGRAAMVPVFAMPMRYAMIAVPAIIICYCSWFLYGPGKLKQLIPLAISFIMFILIIPNSKKGFIWRDWYRDGTSTVLNDIKNGVTISEFVNKNQSFLLHWSKQKLQAGVQQLSEAKIGQFKNIKDDVLMDHYIAPIDHDSNIEK